MWPQSRYCVPPSGYETVIEDRKYYSPNTEVITEVVENVVTVQPELPEQLPETGAVDIIKFAAGAGIATTLGLFLLLLL